MSYLAVTRFAYGQQAGRDREENCMLPGRTKVHLLPSERSVIRAFRSGVSSHSHTEHSRERLGALPRYLQRMPVVSQFVRWEIERYRARTGEVPDFSRAYWRGPVSARAAHDLECKQIKGWGSPPWRRSPTSWPQVTARIFEVYDDLYSRLS